MELILKKDIDKLGKAGEAVSVRDGYARNYLIPQRLALFASPANLKIIEQEKNKAVLRMQKEKEDAQRLADKISTTSCTITVQAGADGKLFGSVTTQDIAQSYKEEGLNIDKRKIELPQPVKEVGIFKIKVRLHPEVVAEAKVWVVKE